MDFEEAENIAESFGEPLLSIFTLPEAEEGLIQPKKNESFNFVCCPQKLSPILETMCLQDMEKTIEGSRFIAQHVKNKDKFESVEEDWKYIAMVLDRLFLWIFTVACILGTALIIMQAPSLYDKAQPIDLLHSKIAKKKYELLKMGKERS